MEADDSLCCPLEEAARTIVFHNVPFFFFSLLNVFDVLCFFRCLCRYCWYTFDVRVTWLQLSVEQEPYKMSRNTPTCTQGGCGHIWNEEEMQRNCDTSVLAKKKKTVGHGILQERLAFWINGLSGLTEAKFSEHELRTWDGREDGSEGDRWKKDFLVRLLHFIIQQVPLWAAAELSWQDVWHEKSYFCKTYDVCVFRFRFRFLEDWFFFIL